MELKCACPSVSLTSTSAIGRNRAGECVSLHYHCAAISISVKSLTLHHSFALLHGIGAWSSISFTYTRATSINKAGACVSHQYSCASQSSHLAPTDFTVSHWLLSLKLSTVVRSLRARASVQPCQNLATPIQKSLACQSCLKLPATWNPVNSGIVNTVGTLLVMLVFQSHL